MTSTSAPATGGYTPAMRQLNLSDAWHLAPWLIAIGFFFIGTGYHSLGANIMVMVLFTLSLDLALGYAGIITLGHAAFFGVGAYAGGVLLVFAGKEPFAGTVLEPFMKDALFGLLFAAALAGLLGFLTGMLILHTHGVAMFMLTLAIASIFLEISNQWRSVTGGDDGLSIPRATPLLAYFGFEGFRFDLWGKVSYLYAMAVLFVWFVIAWIVVKSPFGRSLDGIRQNPRRMRAIGTPVWWRLVAMYALSAAMAGTAGAVQAQTTRTIGLSVLQLELSGIVAVMLVLGGERRLYGAFLGAAIYVIVHDIASAINPFYWMFAVGAMLMIVVLFFEGGLMGMLDKFAGLFKRKQKPSEGSAS